jgi:hypothetical protein
MMMMSMHAGIPVDKQSFYFLFSLIQIWFKRFEPITSSVCPCEATFGLEIACCEPATMMRCRATARRVGRPSHSHAAAKKTYSARSLIAHLLALYFQCQERTVAK